MQCPQCVSTLCIYSTQVQGRNVGSSPPNIRDVDLDLDWLRGVQRLDASGQLASHWSDAPGEYMIPEF